MTRPRSPIAIVLCQASTGIATVRSLTAAGITVHAFILSASDPIKTSRRCVKIDCTGITDDEALIEFLIRHSASQESPPVVFPCSDAHALLLARNAAALAANCRISTTSFADLQSIISKNELYCAAESAGIEIVPHLVEPGLEQLTSWSADNEAPYLLKPFYEAIPTKSIPGKNLTLGSREDLLSHVAHHGARSIVVQRVLAGGDGHIFDCYGYRDRHGRIVALASHRRWRQHPPNFGATSMG